MSKQITYKDFPEIAAYMEKHNVDWYSDEVQEKFNLEKATYQLPKGHHPVDWQMDLFPAFVKLSIDEQILVILFIYQAIEQSE